MAIKTIWTIGHSTRTLDELIALLVENGIQTLVDVRAFPGSRKYPWFGKEALKASLPAAGIEYVHLVELGGRRRGAEDSPNTTWRHPSFRAYADYMETDRFREAIRRLEAIALKRRACLMCSEAVWWRCHRSLISDLLKSQGWDVRHLLGPAVVKCHEYTKPARVESGILTYRPPTPLLDGQD